MKQPESLTDQKTRQTLIASKYYAFENEKICKFLSNQFDSISSVYVLGHTPDQGEDFYTLLINGSTILKLELSRTDDTAKPENVVVFSIEQYRKAVRGRQELSKLAIAIELATEDKIKQHPNKK